VGITGDGATTRYNVSGTVTWTLSRAGERVAGGTVKNFASYSATGSTEAGLTARADAGRRLMVMLADQVVTAMIAALA
jgi:LPS-assembly lipoprotein